MTSVVARLRPPSGAGRSPHEVGEGHVENAGDAEQREQCRIVAAGFDALEYIAADASTQVQTLLADAAALTLGADTVPEDAAALQEPGVIVGCLHSTNRLTKIILSQHDKSGIFE